MALCFFPAVLLAAAITSSGYDSQRVIFILGAGGISVGCLRYVEQPFFTPVYSYLFFTLWLLATLSTAFSPSVTWSAADFATFTALIGLIVVQATLYAHQTRLVQHWIMLVTVIGVCGAALIAILPIAIFARLTGHRLPWPEPLGGFANPRFFNQFQTWMLGVLPYFVLIPSWHNIHVRTRLIRSIAVALLVSLWLFYFRSDGRGTGYAVGIATIVVLLLRLPGATRLAATNLGAALLGYIGARAVFPESQLIHRLDSVALNGRAQLWHHAIQMAWHHPILGAGPMMFAAQRGLGAAHPHDLILLWASEYGIPFALLAITLVGLCLHAWLGFARRQARDKSIDTGCTYWHTALSIALIAGLAHAMVSGVTIMPISQFMMAVVIAFALGEYRARTFEPENDSTTRVKYFGQNKWFPAIVVASACYLAVFVTVGPIWDHTTRVGNVAGQDLKPRFWDDGQLTLRRTDR